MNVLCSGKVHTGLAALLATGLTVFGCTVWKLVNFYFLFFFTWNQRQILLSEKYVLFVQCCVQSSSAGQQPQSVLTQVSSVSDGNYTENRFGFQHQTVTPDNLYIVFVYRKNTPMLRLKVLEDMSVAWIMKRSVHFISHTEAWQGT